MHNPLKQLFAEAVGKVMTGFLYLRIKKRWRKVYVTCDTTGDEDTPVLYYYKDDKNPTEMGRVCVHLLVPFGFASLVWCRERERGACVYYDTLLLHLQFVFVFLVGCYNTGTIKRAAACTCYGERAFGGMMVHMYLP